MPLCWSVLCLCPCPPNAPAPCPRPPAASVRCQPASALPISASGPGQVESQPGARDSWQGLFSLSVCGMVSGSCPWAWPEWAWPNAVGVAKCRQQVGFLWAVSAESPPWVCMGCLFPGRELPRPTLLLPASRLSPSGSLALCALPLRCLQGSISPPHRLAAACSSSGLGLVESPLGSPPGLQVGSAFPPAATVHLRPGPTVSSGPAPPLMQGSGRGSRERRPAGAVGAGPLGWSFQTEGGIQHLAQSNTPSLLLVFVPQHECPPTRQARAEPRRGGRRPNRKGP